MTEPCPVVHFEMPYEDAGRMAAFYEQVFGWKTNALGPEMGHYVLAETTETEAGRAVTPGAINGGFFPRRDDRPAQGPLVVIGVADIAAAMERIGASGGTVHGSPHEIPGVGLYVAFTDCEGNSACMLQPLRGTA
ncbi:VOC family protein [Tropicimonas sediminicola]|uniref:VOC domain-containing protein n=1 Tax=Tropicimonas sediminicola TaxID=1031541 RepID=A0A239ERB2_9RHOB|nr:VOC family protein [Tropicimonas sediminicola]SNS46961.1 hypothetical protein SAMN05421757_102281 [Tropicimonas sediminicola]